MCIRILPHLWPFWGYFDVFCALWCIFGENQVILETPLQRRQMGNRGYHAPNLPHRHASECIFVPPNLLAVTICTRWCVCGAYWGHGVLRGCPKITGGFHQKCTKVHKIHQNSPKGQKWAKICLHMLFGPPPTQAWLEGRY